MTVARTARVVPDVVGLDKAFDYAVPEGLPVDVGTLVRVPLHGRRVGGWVVALDPPDAHGADRAEERQVRDHQRGRP